MSKENVAIHCYNDKKSSGQKQVNFEFLIVFTTYTAVFIALKTVLPSNTVNIEILWETTGGGCLEIITKSATFLINEISYHILAFKI